MNGFCWINAGANGPYKQILGVGDEALGFLKNAFVLLRNTDVDKPCHSWTQRAMFSGTPYRQSSILIILIKRVCVESIQPQHRHWKKIACVSKLNLRYTESRVV